MSDSPTPLEATPPASVGSEVHPATRRLWLISALLIAMIVYTCIPGASVPSFAFVYDDHNQIEHNPVIQNWHYLPQALEGHVWAHKSGNGLYYRPLFMVWMMLTYSVGGLSPVAWHLSVLALHLLATALVYFLALKLTRSEWIGGVAALLFGVNPIHVEAVDWVSGAVAPLAACCFIGALIVWLDYRETRRAAGLVLALVLALAAMLSHETGIAIVALVFAYEWFKPRQPMAAGARLWAAVRAALPFLGVAILYLAARALALEGLGRNRNALTNVQLILAVPVAGFFYLRHLLLPIGLSVFYNFSIHGAMAASAGVLLAAVGVWLVVRRSPAALWMGLWIVITLAPALILKFFTPTELVHDRYLYLPSVGFSVLLAMLLARMNSLNAKLGVALVAAIAIAYGADTAYQGHFWHDGVSLNARGVEIAPGNEIAMHNLGVELMMAQRRPEAITEFQRVLEVDPRSEETLFALGECYYDLDMTTEAASYLKRAIVVDPNDPKTHLFLGLAASKEGRLDEAESQIRAAIALLRVSRGFRGYHIALAEVLERKGDLGGALKEYQTEIDSDPDSDEARAGLDRVQAQLRGQGKS